MRMLLTTALALSLAGCSDMDFFGEESAPPPGPTAAAPVETTVLAEPAAEATNVAPTVPVASAPATPAAPGVQPPPPPSIARTTPPSVHCTELAKLRSRDAAYAGEDEETQDVVYHRTYSDCVTWETRHRS